MKPVKIHEAKTQFSTLMGLVEQGQEIVVQRGDVPVAKLVPYTATQPRKAGALKGQIVIDPDFHAVPDGFEDYVA